MFIYSALHGAGNALSYTDNHKGRLGSSIIQNRLGKPCAKYRTTEKWNINQQIQNKFLHSQSDEWDLISYDFVSFTVRIMTTACPLSNQPTFPQCSSPFSLPWPSQIISLPICDNIWVFQNKIKALSQDLAPSHIFYLCGWTRSDSCAEMQAILC